MMEPFILAVDPGKRIGVSLWTRRGECIWSVVMDFEELDDWLSKEEHLSMIVCEGYRLDHRAARQKGSKLDASQVIGMLRSQAKRKHIDIKSQQNTVLGVAALHAGVKLPTGHLPDQLAAYLHGWYFMEAEFDFKPSQLRALNPLH